LDVSKNTALKTLRCDNNRLAAIDVAANTDLLWFSCENNPLLRPDLSAKQVLHNQNSVSEGSIFLFDEKDLIKHIAPLLNI
jgi:hypothetical protein